MGTQQIIKANIKDAIATALSWTGLTNFSHIPTSSLTILTFHRVLPAKLRASYPLPGLVVTPEELYWVLNIVRTYFDINIVSEAYEFSLKANCQKPQLAITFDDGQWDNFNFGLPVLKELNVPATFYIPTAYIGKKQLLWHDEVGFAWQKLMENNGKALAEISSVSFPNQVFKSAAEFVQHLKGLRSSERVDFVAQLKNIGIEFPAWSRLMSWGEIKYLHENGHEIGSHARTHNLLSHLSIKEQEEELSQSMTDIENLIGVKPDSFCYPDGNFNDHTLNLLKASPYKTAVTTQWGINRKKSNCFKLRRCDIDARYLRNRNGVLSKTQFQFRLSPYQPGL